MRRKTFNKPLRVIHSVDELPVIVDAAEVGLLLRITPEAVNRLARDGVLTGAKLGTGWKFRRDDVQAYMDKLFTGEGCG